MKSVQKDENRLTAIRRAFSEFLLVPSLVILLFIALAWFTNQLDQLKIQWLQPIRDFLQQHFFSDSKATSDLLGAIVSGAISITTLTTTLLLVIVQQSAGSMTSQVFDQFLRRRTNQFYLGFFVGLALYAMVTLATVNAPFNPVLGGTVAFSFTAAALYMLVLLMYTTIDQMRPSQIVHAIYLRILKAHERQLELLSYTTNEHIPDTLEGKPVRSGQAGYLNHIDTKALHAFITAHCPGSKVVFKNTIGNYICFEETLAEVVPAQPSQYELLKEKIRSCVRISIQRDIDTDTAYGIKQLETIAWTSISTAQSNPAPGVLCLNAMHNVLNCFLRQDTPVKKAGDAVLYYCDNSFEVLMQGFETLAVVSSESMQHQPFIEILDILSTGLCKAGASGQARLEKIVLVMLSVMGDHVPTTALDTALRRLEGNLNEAGKQETAALLRDGRRHLAQSLGKLNSRSTRV